MATTFPPHGGTAFHPPRDLTPNPDPPCGKTCEPTAPPQLRV